jgi:sulfur carrier protein
MNVATDCQIEVNGRKLVMPNHCTVVNLLQRLEVHSGAIAVELNGEILPKHDFSATVLRSGDRVEVVSLVGGG